MPSSLTSRSLEQYVELGRMGDALRCLRDTSVPAGIERDLVLAEVSVLAGHPVDAKKCAESISVGRSVTLQQALRARTVLAQVHIDTGGARTAHELLLEIAK